MSPRFRPSSRSRARGFATVEVLVAVAIVLLVGSIAILGFGGTDRARVAAEAAEIALFLQEARMRALEAGQPVEIVLSTREGVLAAGAARHALAAGIVVEPAEARLVLRPSGESEGLAIVLVRDVARAEVVLDWLTGRVDVR